MKKTLILLMLTVLSFSFPAIADNGLPSHYPDGGFSRTGRVDAVFPGESRVVIDDVPYAVSTSTIVHSLTIKNVSLARIRPGILVAFRMGSNREIEEFWLLPANYQPVGRR